MSVVKLSLELMQRVMLGMSVVSAMLMTASPVLAGGVNLAWNNCASEGGVANRVGACNSNAGTNTLTGSFVPSADFAGVIGVEIVVDLIAGDGVAALPPWWEINGVGACRAGSLTPNANVNAGNTICNDWASGASVGGLAAYNTSGSVAPINQPAHRRILMGFAVAVASAADLSAAKEYFAFNANISNAKSVGAGACSGCATPVCIVLNSINIVGGAATHQFVSGGATAADGDKATWQGVGPSCALVRTQNATWGQVKALYHR